MGWSVAAAAAAAIASSAIGSAMSSGGSGSSAGSNAGGKTTDQNQNTSTSSNTNSLRNLSSNSTKNNVYMPSLTDNEKQAMWAKASGRINNSWLSGSKNMANTMASRGLGGGSLASGFAGNDRARNEALSGSAGDIEIAGANKLLQSSSDTTNQTSSEISSQLQQQIQDMLSNMTLNEGSAQNQFGNLLQGVGGMGLANSDKIAKWIKGLGGSGGWNPDYTSSSYPTTMGGSAGTYENLF